MPTAKPSPHRQRKPTLGGRAGTGDGHTLWLRGNTRTHVPEWCAGCLEISDKELLEKVAAWAAAQPPREYEPYVGMPPLDMPTMEDDAINDAMYGEKRIEE